VLKYLAKRLISMIPVVIAITIIIFALVKAMPGDPARMMINPALKEEQREAAYRAMREKLGLDYPMPVQYVKWIAATLSGDLGWSSMNNRPVKEVIAEPLRNTLILNVFVTICEIAVILPVGVVMAVRRGSLIDKFWQVFSLIGYSMPSFFIGLSLIFIFALKLKLLPPGSMPIAAYGKDLAYYLSWFKYMLLPMLSLTIISIAGSIRYVRNAMIEALSQDYIRTARSKGLSEKVVIYSHAFRNALIPISTIIIMSVFALLSGSAITEQVFAWKGIGYTLVLALNNRDYMLVITLNLLSTMLAITANIVADITYGIVDPRIKLE
jgi:peptide/nickel transport system permease protein